ncbi:NUDIX hydrolase domain-like protein [Mycotypha africana]|uniref:NUDIX hydrolase domain-like protein n=1 Tax=Mycotypha africana TaxID=64632 RepID=UPI002300B893|nr:NUDIX hydrolase domain-like protein [Mycotypha africana]KAI8982114.1 NUDIX hydrolase domain-like protein [Mycotypha africana]
MSTVQDKPTPDQQKNVMVGVGCFVTYKDEEETEDPYSIDPKEKGIRILIGQRKGSIGNGTYQLAGGHVELWETFEECAKREILEETNLDLPLEDMKFVTAVNSIMREENRHYITLFVWCPIKDKSVLKNLKVMEPEKLKGEWEWVSIEQLKKRTPLFKPLVKFIEERDFSFLTSYYNKEK